MGDRACARARDSQLDPDAARALIRHVGERQQRLLRELEKLALGDRRPGTGHDSTRRRSSALTRPSAERKAWSLADALVAGDAQAAIAPTWRCVRRASGCPDCSTGCSQRLRTAHEIAVGARRRRAAGADQAAAADALARRRPADRRRPAAPASERLRRGDREIADLELASRGGGERRRERGHRRAAGDRRDRRLSSGSRHRCCGSRARSRRSRTRITTSVITRAASSWAASAAPGSAVARVARNACRVRGGERCRLHRRVPSSDAPATRRRRSVASCTPRLDRPRLRGSDAALALALAL